MQTFADEANRTSEPEGEGPLDNSSIGKRAFLSIPAASKDTCSLLTKAIQDQKERSDPTTLANRLVENRLVCTADQGPDDDKSHGFFHPSTLWRQLISIMPIFTWLPGLRKSTLVEVLTSDIIAGITVGVVAIPQGMSYANIAGLKYQYGLYSALLGPVIYSLFGQSRQLAVGPVAIVSLLTEAGINGLLTQEECPDFFDASKNPDGLGQNEICPDQYAGLVFLCSFWVGVIQLVARLFKLGFLVAFLAHPVISGFTTAAAMIILMSQAKYIVGFPIPKSQYVYETVGHIVMNIGETKPLNCALGLICLIFLLACKSASKKWKKLWWLKSTSPLFVCTLGILILSQTPSLKEDHYVKSVGYIPKGMPPLSINWAFDATARVFPSCITIAIIGYMESIAISKSLAAIHKYSINAGQELLALGMTNLVGSCFSVYPCSGSFCRSSVNNGMGAKSGLSSFVNSIIILAALLFMAPVFYHLPKFVLGAVVMSAVTGLIETGLKDGRQLWKLRKIDFALWFSAWVGTLFLGVIPGIAVAVGISLFFVIYETVKPQFTILWRLPGTSIYRSIDSESSGAFIPGVFIIRVGSSMYFANSAYVTDQVNAYVNKLSRIDPIQYVVLDMTAVTSVDSSAAHALEEMIEGFRSRGITLAFSNVSGGVLRTFRRAHVMHVLGEKWLFSTVHTAVQGCLRDQRDKSLPAPKTEDGHRSSEVSTDEGSDSSKGSPPVEVGDEVSITNEMGDKYTGIYINTRRGRANMLVDLVKIFMRHGVNIIRAEVEKLEKGDSTLMCFWVANHADCKSKLSSAKIEELKSDIDDWLKELPDANQEDDIAHLGFSNPDFEKQISNNSQADRAVSI
eukprot:TRINITY_DN93517_c0_g1_i1.p1 TRINITY_DN93517_c0_g1~~TRINITY_DN93517_c0_g1_i1.p1  ORF type:complete len:852 (+),score=128.71 TRINITY_DN93517_c0_g1_i1:71-2626(+)